MSCSWNTVQRLVSVSRPHYQHLEPSVHFNAVQNVEHSFVLFLCDEVNSSQFSLKRYVV